MLEDDTAGQLVAVSIKAKVPDMECIFFWVRYHKKGQIDERKTLLGTSVSDGLLMVSYGFSKGVSLRASSRVLS